MQRTIAVGSSNGAFVDKVPSPYSPGTTIGATDLNAHQEEIVHVEEAAGLAPSGADLYQLTKAIKKLIKETRHEVGELFPLLDRKAPVAWNDNPDAYFPAVCLSDISAALTLYATGGPVNYPDLVPYLRAYKSTYARGMAGEVADYVVTNWSIAANVATVTLQNVAAVNAILAAMVEELAVNGSYQICITLPAVGNIPAGDYIPTAIDTVNRVITFGCVAANGSGSVTSSMAVMPFRIPGSTTTCRIFPMQGMTIHAANDGNSYFIGGLRRRGFMQGHSHSANNIMGLFGSGSVGWTPASSASAPLNIGSPINDGVSGVPKTAKETHGPALSAHYYMHPGRML